MKLNKNLAISETGFIYHPVTGEAFKVNDTGKEILQMMQEELSEIEIKERFVNEYEVDEVTFERYLVDFIGMLKQYQILENNV